MKKSKSQLDIVIVDGEPRVSLVQLAEYLGIANKSSLNTIYKYEEKLKSKGELIFVKECKKKNYLLNEAQFLFFVTLSRNTDVVIELKSEIVDRFMKMKKELKKIFSLNSTEQKAVGEIGFFFKRVSKGRGWVFRVIWATFEVMKDEISEGFSLWNYYYMAKAIEFETEFLLEQFKAKNNQLSLF